MSCIRLMLHRRVGPEQETRFGESATVCATFAVAATERPFHSGRTISNVQPVWDAKIIHVLPLQSVSADHLGSSCT